MRPIIVDDNRLTLETMCEVVGMVDGLKEPIAFSDAKTCFEYLKNGGEAQVAFLDIIMDGVDGIALANEIRDNYPDIRIIFCSSSNDYAREAYRIHADGYLTKPVNREMIEEELTYIYGSEWNRTKKLQVKCFGRFEAFDEDGHPIRFKRSKSKEILAYLITRNGAALSTRDILYGITDDFINEEVEINNMRQYINALIRTLKDAGYGDVVLREGKSLSVIPSLISCDYYDFLKGDVNVIKSWNGEFMSQYEWAEDICGYVENSILDAKVQ